MLVRLLQHGVPWDAARSLPYAVALTLCPDEQVVQDGEAPELEDWMRLNNVKED